MSRLYGAEALDAAVIPKTRHPISAQKQHANRDAKESRRHRAKSMEDGMTPKQRHELHLFIAEKVMGFKEIYKDGRDKKEPKLQVWFDGRLITFTPTTDYAQALQVLEKCLQKPAISDTVISYLAGTFWVRTTVKKENWIYAQGESRTIPESICLFAKELFSK